MIWPGLGHWMLGRRADAVARFAMFAWAFGAGLPGVAVDVGGSGVLSVVIATFVTLPAARR